MCFLSQSLSWSVITTILELLAFHGIAARTKYANTSVSRHFREIDKQLTCTKWRDTHLPTPTTYLALLRVWMDASTESASMWKPANLANPMFFDFMRVWRFQQFKKKMNNPRKLDVHFFLQCSQTSYPMKSQRKNFNVYNYVFRIDFVIWYIWGKFIRLLIISVSM